MFKSFLSKKKWQTKLWNSYETKYIVMITKISAHAVRHKTCYTAFLLSQFIQFITNLTLSTESQGSFRQTLLWNNLKSNTIHVCVYFHCSMEERAVFSSHKLVDKKYPHHTRISNILNNQNFLRKEIGLLFFIKNFILKKIILLRKS